MKPSEIASRLKDWCGGDASTWERVVKEVTWACSVDPGLKAGLVAKLRAGARRYRREMKRTDE